MKLVPAFPTGLYSILLFYQFSVQYAQDETDVRGSELA